KRLRSRKSAKSGESVQLEKRLLYGEYYSPVGGRSTGDPGSVTANSGLPALERRSQDYRCPVHGDIAVLFCHWRRAGDAHSLGTAHAGAGCSCQRHAVQRDHDYAWYGDDLPVDHPDDGRVRELSRPAYARREG